MNGQGGRGFAAFDYTLYVICVDDIIAYTYVDCKFWPYDICYPSSIPNEPCFAEPPSVEN